MMTEIRKRLALTSHHVLPEARQMKKKKLAYGAAVKFLLSIGPNRRAWWPHNIRSLYNAAKRHRIAITASRVGKRHIVGRTIKS